MTPTLAAEFDREREIVLDRVKQSKDLADLHELLNKWRHIAYAEMRDPGVYYRMLSKAEQILRTGGNANAVPFEEMQALIHQRHRCTESFRTRTLLRRSLRCRPMP